MIIEVLDDGPGLSRPLTELIQPFTQGDESSTRRHNGSGLGLALTAQLVEQLGGRLSAANRPSGGAHFIVTLPLPVAQPPARPAPVRLCGRVLIVDDNPLNRRVLRGMLERLGAVVDEAVDGVDGLERMTATRYPLVLLDHHMPRMDGLEAARRARACGVESVLIAVTASAQPGAREASLAAGMDAHITKPIRIQDLQVVLIAQQDAFAS